ncbi:unnamed protein product [Danaus chrysippus]|uniref:lysozyme n=1 Tax=Danaus chrysippus TaxID=151541 RepID=A0A8J2QKF7_9NEOP|nr:unnamed protein product [Danaus chrysippus]
MATRVKLLAITSIVAALSFIECADVPNLNQACFRCLCHVYTNCMSSDNCFGDYCGPFTISKVYWNEAGKITLPGDDPASDNAWRECATDYNCAQKIVKGYLQKFAKDCNNDGEINCFDYMMINSNGGYNCTPPLDRTETGRMWLERYEECHTKLNLLN